MPRMYLTDWFVAKLLGPKGGCHPKASPRIASRSERCVSLGQHSSDTRPEDEDDLVFVGGLNSRRVRPGIGLSR